MNKIDQKLLIAYTRVMEFGRSSSYKPFLRCVVNGTRPFFLPKRYTKNNFAAAMLELHITAGLLDDTPDMGEEYLPHLYQLEYYGLSYNPASLDLDEVRSLLLVTWQEALDWYSHHHWQNRIQQLAASSQEFKRVFIDTPNSALTFAKQAARRSR